MSAATASPRAGEAGLTLLEVLAALTVFLVGVVGVISLLASGTHMHRTSESLSEASDLVEEVVLLIENDLLVARTDSETGLPMGPTESLSIPGKDGMFYRWWVSAGELAPPYLLEIAIYWQEGGQLRSLEAHRVLTGLLPQTRVIRRLKNGPPQ